MRHKYETRAIVLSRSSVGEASVFVILLTPDLGLIRALAQSMRKSGAKLSHALTTFTESDVVLVRGRDGWRLAGAVLVENWFARLGGAEPRERAGRLVSLLLRLVAGEERETGLYPNVIRFLEALATLPVEQHEDAEILSALRMLATLGLDTGEVLQNDEPLATSRLTDVANHRAAYIARINNGINASGL